MISKNEDRIILLLCGLAVFLILFFSRFYMKSKGFSNEDIRVLYFSIAYLILFLFAIKIDDLYRYRRNARFRLIVIFIVSITLSSFYIMYNLEIINLDIGLVPIFSMIVLIVALQIAIVHKILKF